MKTNTSTSRRDKVVAWLLGIALVACLLVLGVAVVALFYYSFTRPGLSHLRAPAALFGSLALVLVVAGTSLVVYFFRQKGVVK
jgi:ABC-type sugar transport system permease subunit